MRIEVLGPIRLSADDDAAVDVAERHLRLLLASLIAADGDPVSADTLIDRLWDTDLPVNPRKVLRAKLSRLRTVLDEARLGARDLLTHTPAGYRLAVPTEDVDAGQFKKAVEHARSMATTNQKTRTLRAALGIWRGDPYGDATEELWLAPTVADLRRLRGDALETLAETLLDQGEPEQALSELNSAAAEYPTRERLISAAMRALYLVGRQHEALEVFEGLRYRLAEDLGVDPSTHVRELHGRILRQDPALAAAASVEAVTPARVGRSNVPAEAAPLIGRQREIERIAALLDEARLVTLTGIGGVGKTRLAVRLAWDRREQVERGVWFLDLTELTTPTEDQAAAGERVAGVAVNALDLPERTSTTSDSARLRAALGDESALFVLDNCEHVIIEAAAFAAELLRAAPGVRVLTTSREPLGLPAEHRYNVDTLNTKPDETHSVSEAVEFFVARARTSDPSFQLDEETTGVVTELCRRLDGLPLALELAAARIRGISVRDLLERLSDRLNILHRPGGRVPRRQQTLRGMIDWSWSLLAPTERRVLRRLAVHPGSLTLAAAETICADDPEDDADLSVGPTQVVDVLIGLVDRSMVTTVSTSAGIQYGLLESIAAFATEKLDEAGERDRVAHCHLRYYLDRANEAQRRLKSAEQRRWLARLEAERTQLRNAFDEAVHNQDGGSAVALAVATFWFHWISGRHRTLGEYLRIATELPGPRDNSYAAAATLSICLRLEHWPGDAARLIADSLTLFAGDDVARARTQWFAGASLLAVGVREAGLRHVDDAIGVLLEVGADWDSAVAACQRDWFLINNWGERPRGLPDGRDPERVLRDLGDGWGLAQALSVEHRIAETDGDHVRAAYAAQRTLDVCLEFELWAEASEWCSATAVTALRAGDVPLALDRLARARSLAADIAYFPGSCAADFTESMILRYEGDLDQARILLERWMTGAGMQSMQDPNSHIERGFLAVRQEDLNRAEEALRTLRALIPLTAHTPIVASFLELAAAAHALRAEATTAAEMLGTAATLHERTNVAPSMPARQDIDRVWAMIEVHLPRPEADVAFDRGRAADPDRHLRALALSP